MRSEGSRFTWWSGGEAVFAKTCSMLSTVRNRPQPSPYVCVSAVKLSAVASAPGVVPKACQWARDAAVTMAFAEEVSG